MSKQVQCPVVVLNDGKTEDAVVFIHPVGGQIHWYKEIIRALPSDISVKAVMSPGLLDQDYEYQDIKALAQSYIEHIIVTEKHRNYVIVGWSFGCEVAFEITKTLDVLGHSVSMIILDPQVMTDQERGPVVCFREVLEKEYRLSSHLEDFGDPVLSNEEINQRIEGLMHNLVASGQIKSDYKRHYTMALKVYFFNLISMCNYSKDGYVSKIVMIKCANDEVRGSDMFTFMRQANAEDWRQRTSNLKTMVVPGDHYTMLCGESAKVIASEIGNCVG